MASSTPYCAFSKKDGTIISPSAQRDKREAHRAVASGTTSTVRYYQIHGSTRAHSHQTIRLITGRCAFTDKYTACFLGNNSLSHSLWEELVACPCRKLPQTVKHVLLKCPIYNTARCRHHCVQKSLIYLITFLINFLKTCALCWNPRKKHKLA